MTAAAAAGVGDKRRRFRLLYRLEAELEPIMFLLAILWLWFFIVELAHGLAPWQQKAIVAIWIAFIFEFLLKLYLAPRRLQYLLKNWIAAVALVVPAFRTLRLLRALRILRTARIASTGRVVRALTSGRRLYHELKEAQGPAPEPEMDVGLLVMTSPSGDAARLEALALTMTEPVREEMEAATGLRWNFHAASSRQLQSDDARRPSEFLDEASMSMAEGPYDMIVVITDVVLVARERQVQTGVASPTARIAVISTRQLIATERGLPPRELESPAVALNASTLLLQLIGRISGLDRDSESPVMRRFAFRESRRSVPQFNKSERVALSGVGERLPERELRGEARLASLVFHVLMALRHPAQTLKPLWRNKAPLLPLSLPGLATAAVAPSFLLVFTAEIWDVGLGMSNRVAFGYASLSILGASLFLARVQSLFLPRKKRNVLTEHLAVANTTIFLSVLLACVGLFLMVAVLMLVIELWVFPADLMQTWPTLDQPAAAFGD
ncbi:MAG TPA: hypothetical protein VHG33_04625, partial [Woeseiaceae bacterium]|nr:hypothetical protein [Woeseiaceae bacterium]